MHLSAGQSRHRAEHSSHDVASDIVPLVLVVGIFQGATILDKFIGLRSTRARVR